MLLKKNHYLIFFINKTLTYLKNAKYFIKIDINQSFYQIRKFKDFKKLATILKKYNTFKCLVAIYFL